ncbi:MAG: hypothetical protein H7645_00825 [Candidatus Heimdallarchaeota archaeon]|nr:hypothetical protein [Candidatus Heimdallarchaeota archaeon]MCK4768858.1 hypothetical protein [Candidatus Heimdallarchaeota archaeon]
MSTSSGSTLKPLLIRIGFGLVLPFLIELFVYIIYTGLKYQDFQFSALLIFVFFIIPILFLYLIAPKIIFNAGRVRNQIESNLRSNLDNIFFKPRSFSFGDKTVPLTDMELKLPSKEKKSLEAKIKKELIPKITEEAKKQYSQNFVDRSHTTGNERLLTYNESLYLFSIVSSAILFINLILVFVLRWTSIKLDFIIIDQIENNVNIVIFICVFGILLLCGVYLSISSSRRLCGLIPKVLSIIYYEPEEEREKRLLIIKSIAEFPISNLFVRRTQRELAGTINEAKKNLLLTRLTETISWYYREELAKSTMWELYKEMLEELQISDETKDKIEQHFKYDPLLQLISSQILTTDEEQAIKADIDYVNEKIKNWDKIRSEEQTLSFLLIYRTLETIFRRTLPHVSTEPESDEVNFLKLIDILENNKILSKSDVALLHEIRFKRNLLFHEPGKSLDIGKQTMKKLLLIIKKVLDKIGETEKEG